MPPPDDEEWADEEAGPVVRPYALTGGRTRHSGVGLDLMAVIETVNDTVPDALDGGPEHRRILRLCRSPLSVAEVASELDLPVDVVRVLLGDLAEHELILVRQPVPVAQFPDVDLLEQVIDGLRAL